MLNLYRMKFSPQTIPINHSSNKIHWRISNTNKTQVNFYFFNTDDIFKYEYNTDSALWQKKWSKSLEIEHSINNPVIYFPKFEIGDDRPLVIIKTTLGINFYHFHNDNINLVSRTEDFEENIYHDIHGWESSNNVIKTGHFYRNQTIIGIFTKHQELGLQFHGIDKNALFSGSYPIFSLNVDLSIIGNDLQSDFYFADIQNKGQENLIVRNRNGLNIYKFNINNDLELVMEIPSGVKSDDSEQDLYFPHLTGQSYRDIVVFNSSGMFIYKYASHRNNYLFNYYDASFSDIKGWTRNHRRSVIFEDINLDGEDELLLTGPRGSDIMSFDKHENIWQFVLDDSELAVSQRHNKIMTVMPIAPFPTIFTLHKNILNLGNLVLETQTIQDMFTTTNDEPVDNKISHSTTTSLFKVPSIIQTQQLDEKPMILLRDHLDTSSMINAVDKYTGRVNFHIPLVDLSNVLGDDIKLNIIYNGIEQESGIMGIGWSLPQNFITMDHQSTIHSELHQYYIVMEDMPTPLTFDRANSTDTIYLFNLPNAQSNKLQISYYVNEEKWIVKNSEVTQIYGRADASQVDPIIWDIGWENWRGAGNSSTGQKKIATSWYLSKLQKENTAINFLYNIIEAFIPNSYTTFTREVYLKSISSLENEIIFKYLSKNTNEYNIPEIVDQEGFIRPQLIQSQYLCGYSLSTPIYQQNINFIYTIENEKRFLTEIRQQEDPTNNPILHFTYKKISGSYVVEEVVLPRGIYIQFQYQSIGEVSSITEKLGHIRLDVAENHQVHLVGDDIIISYFNEDGKVVLKKCSQEMINNREISTIYPLLGRGKAEKFEIIPVENFFTVIIYYSYVKELHLLQKEQGLWERTGKFEFCLETIIKFGKNFILTIEKNSFIKTLTWNTDSKFWQHENFPINSSIEPKVPLVLTTYNNMFLAYDGDIFWVGYKDLKQKWNSKKILKWPKAISSINETLGLFELHDKTREQLANYFTANAVQLYKNIFTVSKWFIEGMQIFTAIDLFVMNDKYEIAHQMQYNITQDDLSNFELESKVGDNSFTLYYTKLSDKIHIEVKNIQGPIIKKAYNELHSRYPHASETEIQDAAEKFISEDIKKNVNFLLNPSNYIAVLNSQTLICGNKTFTFMGNDWRERKVLQEDIVDNKMTLNLGEKYILSKEDSDSFIKLYETSKGKMSTGESLANLKVTTFRNVFNLYPIYIVSQNTSDTITLLHFSIVGQFDKIISLPQEEQFTPWSNYQTLVTKIENFGTEKTFTLVFRQMLGLVRLLPNPVVTKVTLVFNENYIRSTGYEYKSPKVYNNKVYYQEISIIPGDDKTLFGWIKEIKDFDDFSNTYRKIYDGQNILIKTEHSIHVQNNQDPSTLHSNPFVASTIFDKSDRLKVAEFFNYRVLDDEVGYYGFEDYEYNEINPKDSTRKWIFEESGIKRNEFSFTGRNHLHLSGTILSAYFEPKDQFQSYIASCWIRPSNEFANGISTAPYLKAVIEKNGRNLYTQLGEIKYRSNDWYYLEVIVDLLFARGLQMALNNATLQQSYDDKLKVAIIVAPQLNITIDLDHIRFSPLSSDFRANIYNIKTGRISERIYSNGLVKRFINDNSQNEIASLGDYGYVEEIKIITKASSISRISKLYSVVQIHPEIGYYENFSPFSFQQHWKIQNAQAWKIFPNKIHHFATTKDELQINTTQADMKSFGIRLYYSMESDESSLKFGNHIEVQRTAVNKTHISIGKATFPALAMAEVVIVIENTRLFIWIDGGLYYDGPSHDYSFNAWQLTGRVTINDVFVFSKSNIKVNYFNSLNEKLQEILLENEHTVLVTEYLYDEIGRQDITTQTARILKPPNQPLLSYHTNFVTNKNSHSKNSIWRTGELQGEAKAIIGNYGYTQIKYNRNPLNEKIAEGLPGKEYLVSSLLAKRFSSSCTIPFINTAYPIDANYTHQVEIRPGHIQYITVLDSDKNTIAKYIDAPKIADILSTFQYNKKGKLIKVLSPLYHEKAKTLKSSKTPNETISTEMLLLQEKLSTSMKYNDDGEMVAKTSPDSQKVEHIYNDDNLLKFTIYFGNDIIENVVYYQYDEFGRLHETGTLLEFNNNFSDGAKNIQLASNNTQKYQQFHYSNLEHNPTFREKVKRTITYNNEVPFIEEFIFNTNDNILSKGIVVSVQDNNGVKIMAINKQYVAGKVKVIEYPINIRGQPFRLTYQYNKLNQIIGMGTPGDKYSVMKFYYNADGQVSKEQYLPNSNKTFGRHYTYNSAGFLSSLQDKFLLEEITYTKSGYGGTGYSDGTITSTKFHAKWHNFINNEGLGIHQHSFVSSLMPYTESELCFNQLHQAGYLNNDNRQVKIFYPQMIADFPIICSYGKGSRQIQNILGKQGFPEQYGHTYDYGPYQELTKAKYFVGNEIPSPLQPDTFSKEISRMNNNDSHDIWRILNQSGYITIDSAKHNSSLAHGKQTNRSYIRSKLFEDLRSVNETYSKYEQPLQRLLTSSFSHKLDVSSIRTLLENSVRKWNFDTSESEVQQITTMIIKMLETKNYLSDPLAEEFRKSLQMYQVYIPDIVRVLQKYFARQLGEGEFDMQSYNIDANGNHKLFYVGFDRYELFYHDNSNRINYITRYSLSSLEPPQNFTLKHDSKGNVIQALHKGIGNIEYHAVSNRPMKVTLVDGRSINFHYDAQGERILKKVNNNRGETITEIHYFRDESGRVLVEKKVTYISLNLPPDQQFTAYVYGPRGLVGFIRQDDFYSVLSDHEGSVRLIIRDDEVVGVYDYLPYGDMMRKHIVYPDAYISYLYTGQELDEETGLYNFHARFYDPTIGRFFQMDPQEQYFSPYKYAGNSPVSMYDPNGEFAFLIPLIFVGTALGGYLGGAAANGNWNPKKWELDSASTWVGIFGGAVGGALLPVGFGASVGAFQLIGLSAGAASTATVSLGVGAAYLHAAATNGIWDPAKWNWTSPATYNGIFQGFGAGAGIAGGISNTKTFYLELSNKWSKAAFIGGTALSGASLVTLNGFATNWDFSHPAMYVGMIDSIFNAGDLPMLVHSSAKFFARRGNEILKDAKELRKAADKLFKRNLADSKINQKTLLWLEEVMDSNSVPFLKQIVKTWNAPFISSSVKLLGSGVVMGLATFGALEDQHEGWDATKYYALVNGLSAGGQLAFLRRSKNISKGRKLSSGNSKKISDKENILRQCHRRKRSTKDRCVPKLRKNHDEDLEDQIETSNTKPNQNQEHLNPEETHQNIKNQEQQSFQKNLLNQKKSSKGRKEQHSESFHEKDLPNLETINEYKAVVEEHKKISEVFQSLTKKTIGYYFEAIEKSEEFKELVKNSPKRKQKITSKSNKIDPTSEDLKPLLDDTKNKNNLPPKETNSNNEKDNKLSEEDDTQIPNRVVSIATTDKELGLTAVAFSGTYGTGAVLIYDYKNKKETFKALHDNKIIAEKEVKINDSIMEYINAEKNNIREHVRKAIVGIQRDLENSARLFFETHGIGNNNIEHKRWAQKFINEFNNSINDILNKADVSHKTIEKSMNKFLKTEIQNLSNDNSLKEKLEFAKEDIQMFLKDKNIVKIKTKLQKEGKPLKTRFPPEWGPESCAEPHVIFTLSNIKYYVPDFELDSISIKQVTHMGAYKVNDMTLKEFKELKGVSSGPALEDLIPIERCNYCKETTKLVPKFITDPSWSQTIEKYRYTVDKFMEKSSSNSDKLPNLFTNLKISDELKNIRRRKRSLTSELNGRLLNANVKMNGSYSIQLSHSHTDNKSNSNVWIRDWLNWMSDSIGNLFGSHDELLTEDSHNSTILTNITGLIDANSTILLLDLLVRKMNGKKHSKKMKTSELSLLDIQGHALNILEEFENILVQAARKSGIPDTSINFDPITAQAVVIKLLRNGDASKISQVLLQYANEINPGLKQNSTFIKHLKDGLESTFESYS